MNIIRRFLPFLKPYTGRIALMTGLSAILSVLGTASITVILPIMRLIFPDTGNSGIVSVSTPGAANSLKGWFLDAIQTMVISPTDVMVSLRNLCFLVVAIFVAKNIAKYALNVLSTRVEEGLMKDVRDTIFSRTINLSLNFFNSKRSGELISVVTNDVATMNGALTPLMGKVFQEPFQIVLMLAFLLALSPTLTLIALSSSVLSLILIRLLRGRIKKYSGRLQDAMSDITSRLQETFQNIRIVKGYSAENYETARFKNDTAGYVRSALKHSATVNLMSPVGEIFAIAALAVVLFYGGYQVLHHSMRADELMTFLFLLFAIMQPITSVLSIPATIGRGLVAGERVIGIMEMIPAVQSGPRTNPALRNELQLLNVDFSYREGHPVVRDVTLTIKRGQTVALVGPSGGGKSTLIDLMVRFYDPLDGGIYLDGVDIREFGLEPYRELFGIVSQESILFNDSVRNNISYSAQGAGEDKVREAASMANAHEFIDRLPQGYDTPIGDRGVLLSGGQRQRLAIARALVRNPQILLFDEATSALDTESEKLVQDAISNLLKDRTAIVIAHRLSTIKNADLIAVVENGTIVQQGTHDELLALGGLYKKLYDVQFSEN